MIRSAVAAALVLFGQSAAGASPADKSSRHRMDAATAVKLLSEVRAPVSERVSAARALAGTEDAAALDALARALDVTNEDIQAAARQSLTASGGAARFAKVLGDASVEPTRRKQAANVLRHLKDPATVPALATCLSDRDAELRRACAHALAVFGARDAEKALIAAADDASSDVRYFVVLALGEVGTPAARATLEQRLRAETDATIREDLERLLRK